MASCPSDRLYTKAFNCLMSRTVVRAAEPQASIKGRRMAARGGCFGLRELLYEVQGKAKEGI